MGSYLVVSGKEINIKSRSATMIEIMREILPHKKSLYEPSFTLEMYEVAEVLYQITDMVEFDGNIHDYIDLHPNGYIMDEDFEYIKETLLYTQQLFSKVLCTMVVDERPRIICHWV